MLKSYSPATGICYKADVQKFKNSKITELSWRATYKNHACRTKLGIYPSHIIPVYITRYLLVVKSALNYNNSPTRMEVKRCISLEEC